MLFRSFTVDRGQFSASESYAPAGLFPAAVTMISVDTHPERNVIRVQLRQNIVLKEMTDAERSELERHLVVVDSHKGDALLHQGVHEMEQYFVLDGILKRVVTNAQAKEMILRLAAETEMDTSYAAWRLNTLTPYSIVALTNCRVARMPLESWVEFLEHHGELKLAFEYEVMRLMSEVMAHTITLHLLDASGRLARFKRKHPELVNRIPKKELAAYLNITPETLSRVKVR